MLNAHSSEMSSVRMVFMMFLLYEYTKIVKNPLSTQGGKGKPYKNFLVCEHGIILHPCVYFSTNRSDVAFVFRRIKYTLNE